MYGKIFESIYDGTLVEDWRALITFQQMIVLCDADGIIDMTPTAISGRTGIPIEHIKAGIEILEHEDPFSRTKTAGGRRILRLDDHRPWGWSIVNHEKYKLMVNAETVREQNRERKRKQRLKEKDMSRSVTDGHTLSRMSRHTDTDTNTIKHMPKSDDLGFIEFWKLYPRKATQKKARTAWNRIPKSEHEKIFADIKIRFKDTSIKFVPYPSTYLNGERWKDPLQADIETNQNWQQAYL